MTSNLAFDFSVDKENNVITVKREFAAERPLVWDAYTKSELLDQWWAPKPWKADTKNMDFREGGQWHYAMRGPEGEEHWSVANYQTIRPRQYFSGLDAFADANAKVNTEMPQSKWEVSFSDRGENTLVETKITFDDLAQLETTIEMGFREGYASAMENLDELLAKHKK